MKLFHVLRIFSYPSYLSLCGLVQGPNRSIGRDSPSGIRARLRISKTWPRDVLRGRPPDVCRLLYPCAGIGCYSYSLRALVYGYPAPAHTLTENYGSADWRKREFSVGCTLGRNPDGGLRSLWHGLCKAAAKRIYRL